MSYTIEATVETLDADEQPGILKRTAVLAYGILSYCVGVIGLAWIILGVGGLVPVGISGMETTSAASALLVNLGLIALFGIQHSVMPRKSFKQWLTHIMPEATVRASYMLMSGLVSITALYFWQSLPGTVWTVENTQAQIVLWVVYALGWSYLLIATFITNHFELMGLRQAYLYFRNIPYTTLPFTRKFMYSYSRHPMMLGFIIGMWCMPVMSVTQFVISLTLTGYIFIGILFEERDMVKEFGKTYRQYKNDIATFIPRLY